MEWARGSDHSERPRWSIGWPKTPVVSPDQNARIKTVPRHVDRMSLRKLDLNLSYDSDEDDILGAFYVPALKESVRYDRIAGYFSSTSLAVAAEGIASLVVGGGKMRLIISMHLSEEDYRAIESGSNTPEEVVSTIVLGDLQDLEDEIRSDHVKALGWMVANGTLQIKIAITDKGIFHQKRGILEDAEGNKISFSGSDNESASGWLGNVEEFKVFRSWDASQSGYLDLDLEKFADFWEGRTRRTRVIDIPTAIRERLIEISPKDENEWELLKGRLDSYSHKGLTKRQLRKYQRDAILNWKKNGYIGIFEMATGTGKTFTAINGIKELIKEKGKGILIVVACPYTHLIRQWVREFETEGMSATEVYGASSSKMAQVRGELRDLAAGYIDHLVLVTTYNTFATDDFRGLLRGRRVALVCDEVHSVGTELRSEYLSVEYEFRLGMSATPRRWLDPIGTASITDYFGSVVFSFGLREAIDAGFLVPYEYHLSTVEMTGRELDDFASLTKRILYASSGAQSDEKEERVTRLLIKRRNIVKNAAAKIDRFKHIISEMGSPERLLVYCSNEQIDSVMRFLGDSGVVYHRFTHFEDSGSREELLDEFAKGTYKALVAMKCLDEGVDVPPVERVILLASSGNPKEFIQRRGRVLRKSEATGKSRAVIHDIIVVPPRRILEEGNAYLEKAIMKAELDRYYEFAENSLNPLDSARIIVGLMEKYKFLADNTH